MHRYIRCSTQDRLREQLFHMKEQNELTTRLLREISQLRAEAGRLETELSVKAMKIKLLCKRL
ncbi:hypothetical protein BKA67DRAFT_571664 [Truncatella angustata]|uniref:Uncharacterized protein n=1 Tax=Truncatella angustata TaxID=152316 RepID=A0A9P8ZV75_9PEZI|nr:uncharacterized protein BKA67DRAFT_571664 [Truncatella angustata]KAH6651721.1 hypothetical protein BKA67DRAFT_571664 [Truncatella angustata]